MNEREQPKTDEKSPPPSEPRVDEETLDEEVEESFPASDPPSTSVPVRHVGSPERREGQGR